MLRSDFIYFADTLDCLLSSPSLPITEALYNTILYILYDTISSLRRPLLVRYDLVLIVLYDINLGATITTILSTWGVTIPIGLVSSTTDSI